jgi:hypothetical protein
MDSSAVRRPRTREVVPRCEHPNFRDHGRTVDRALLNVLASLQRKYGLAFASEAGLRRFVCEDTGHMPGVDTIPCALERLEAQGLVEQRWLLPGGVLPDGRVCTYGTRLVWLPQCRRARRGLQVRNRREGVSNRVQRRMVASIDQAKREAFATPAAGPSEAALSADRKRAALAALADLSASWERERAARPPD